MPDELLGRVIQRVRAASPPAGGRCGALLGGILAHDFGLTAPFWFAFAVVGTLALASSRIFAAQALPPAGDRTN